MLLFFIGKSQGQSSPYQFKEVLKISRAVYITLHYFINLSDIGQETDRKHVGGRSTNNLS